MGIHVTLHYADGREWDAWDSCRYAGDREFAIGDGVQSDRSVLSLAKDSTYPEDRGYRPVDFQSWRDRFCGPDAVNAERFSKALDFLEANAGSYIRTSW